MQITPDLLVYKDGCPVSAEGWERRRNELYDAIIPHEYGGLPPAGECTEVILRSRGRVRDWPGVTLRTYEVRTRFEDGRELSITLRLWRPPGEGPFPVVLDADGCWQYFNDTVVHDVLARGNIAASLDRTEAAADNPELFRTTGLYRWFPRATFGALSAWAWACHRAIDALIPLDDVRAEGIALTGHSRGGKTVLLAGATDPRICVINPNNSGIGGSGLHRIKAEGSETVDSFIQAGSICWFGPEFATYQHRDGELPYDQHFLHALIAPRRLLVTEAYEDRGANPAGSYAACQAARAVYDTLGAPAAIGWAFREGGHTHARSDYEALLDLLDRHLHGRDVIRDFQRPLFPHLESVCPPCPVGPE